MFILGILHQEGR